MICEIPVKVSFLKHTVIKKDSGVVEGDYNSTKLVFEFEEDVAGKRIEFVMSNPDGELIFMGDLKDNEVVLTGYTDEGKLCSLFNTSGPHAFELVYHGDNSQLTSATGWLHVSNRQVDAVETGSASLYALGKQAEYDAFWDAYQWNGERKDYRYAFAGFGWEDEFFIPKYDIRPTGAADSMFHASNIKNVKELLEKANIVIDLSEASTIGQLFNGSSVTHFGIIAATRVSTANYILYAAKKLVSVEKIILKSDGTQTFTQFATNANELVDITFEGVIGQNGLNLQWSTKLSHDSLMSLINALQDKSTDTSGTVWVVTIGSENYAKLTDEDIRIATQKGWEFA